MELLGAFMPEILSNVVRYDDAFLDSSCAFIVWRVTLTNRAGKFPQSIKSGGSAKGSRSSREIVCADDEGIW